MLYEGIQLGHYKLIHLIGRGGAGEVYLAEDQRVKRQVAVKIVQSDGVNDRDAAHIFQREAETIAILNHPHILPLFDLGEGVVNGQTLAYLVTPFCSEGSLTTWLQNRQKTLVLAPLVINALVQQATDALEHAHDKQIIHRDVKPSNFLVRAHKDVPDLLLADFGIARLAQTTVNASKTIRGTPTYMAPEQWSSGAVLATDQYALAIMVYELLVGRPPFQGTQEQMMYQHIMTPPVPPSMLKIGIPSSVDEVLLRALAKEPSARFPSISEFARAIQGAVTASPSSTFSTPSVRETPIEMSDSAAHAPSFLAQTPIVEPGSRPPIRDTPHTTPGIPQHDEVFTTLNISTMEAIQGVRCTLTLADKQKVRVTVPPGAHDGQIIRVKLPPGSTLTESENGSIVVTLLVTPTLESATVEDIPGLAPSRIQWRRLALIAGVLAVLVILVGSITGIFSFGTNQFGSHFTDATAIASKGTIQAMQVHYGTATAQAGVIATTTAQAVATAAITKNLNDPDQNKLVLNEALNRSSNAGWASRNGNCAFTTEGYHVVSTEQVQACTYTTSYSDMTFQVQMKILKGSGGLLFRSTNTASYYFHVSQDRKYALFLCAGSGTSCNTTLLSNFSSALTTGLNQQNVLAVSAKGNSIQLFINNVPIDTISDSTSLRGQIGVVADAHSEVVYSNANVWTA